MHLLPRTLHWAGGRALDSRIAWHLAQECWLGDGRQWVIACGLRFLNSCRCIFSADSVCFVIFDGGFIALLMVLKQREGGDPWLG
jgi:hypothetical protein